MTCCMPGTQFQYCRTTLPVARAHDDALVALAPPPGDALGEAEQAASARAAALTAPAATLALRQVFLFVIERRPFKGRRGGRPRRRHTRPISAGQPRPLCHYIPTYHHYSQRVPV